ncbi:peptide/nickel transport system ATP-binding protein/oligopeptide transport system ATP-binding protein [Pseudorhizobium tarimense]|uniref:Peptide/nickel transport system ATP-binding protein/oligopeptide transport system ATP-binding protein n=1 Tax=Pseudorhizobium tarimense TaxID=1079109 RepID=A0ABV2HBJ4_9HYPH|nr:ABC transporter ATP-binding protein [Pseudorhizobium tarimense]MCJ8520923.1 ABC transporter ATP-binding protein [Pseudorhizobium tarimense]
MGFVANTLRLNAEAQTAPLLSVDDLTVSFPTKGGGHNAVVTGLSYQIAQSETLGVVGESGCGKTMTSLSLMGLVPGRGRVTGRIGFEGRDLLQQSEKQWRDLRGREVAMIFQEPMTAMNPVMSVGQQIAEVLKVHEGLGQRDSLDRAIDLLKAVGIPSPAQRARDFPHQLSGGMRQRAMIAMALACRPKLLVADEPTTALDVTIQAQILDLIIELQEETGMAVQFITHNLAVVSELAHKILVMYAGRGVEYATSEQLFDQPLHPYTQGLIQTLPDPDRKVDRLHVIHGSLRVQPAQGCRFASRCPLASDECRAAEPILREVAPGHFVACVKVN